MLSFFWLIRFGHYSIQVNYAIGSYAQLNFCTQICYVTETGYCKSIEKRKKQFEMLESCLHGERSTQLSFEKKKNVSHRRDEL